MLSYCRLCISEPILINDRYRCSNIKCACSKLELSEGDWQVLMEPIRPFLPVLQLLPRGINGNLVLCFENGEPLPCQRSVVFDNGDLDRLPLLAVEFELDPATSFFPDPNNDNNQAKA